ncbi:hypothetical protein EG832_11530 [bacterium]|nr:hypothetical protein [bacterium]
MFKLWLKRLGIGRDKTAVYDPDLIAWDTAKLLKKYPKASFGKFLKKAEVELALKLFNENEKLEEVFLEIEIRVPEIGD